MTRHTPNWLQQATYPAATDRDVLAALWPAPAVTGCAVTEATGMTVNVAAGKVAVPSNNNTGTALCTSDAVEQVTLAQAGGVGLNRIDLVVAQLRANDIDGGANNDFLFQAVTGTAAGTPTPPATPANAVALAQIYVPAQSASITAGNITDVRPAGLAVPPWAGAPPFCHLTQATSQSVPNTIGTIINYDTVAAAWQTAHGWDLTNHRWIVPLTGRILVTATVGFAAGVWAFLQVQKNGTGFKRGAMAYLTGTATGCGPSVTATVPCVAGDNLQIQTINGGGGGTSVGLGGLLTWAAFDYIGP